MNIASLLPAAAFTTIANAHRETYGAQAGATGPVVTAPAASNDASLTVIGGLLRFVAAMI